MIKLILEERAKINIADDYKSLFPFYKYGIVVKRESPDSNKPHIFIYDSAKQWKWKIELDTLKICEFYSRGKRRDFNPQQFEEIINNMKIWLDQPTSMPGCIGTNREAAYNELEACNAD